MIKPESVKHLIFDRFIEAEMIYKGRYFRIYPDEDIIYLYVHPNESFVEKGKYYTVKTFDDALKFIIPEYNETLEEVLNNIQLDDFYSCDSEFIKENEWNLVNKL